MTYSVQRSAYIDKSGDGSVCALLLEVITGHSGAQPNILIPPFTITNTGIGNIDINILNPIYSYLPFTITNAVIGNISNAFHLQSPILLSAILISIFSTQYTNTFHSQLPTLVLEMLISIFSTQPSTTGISNIFINIFNPMY